MRKSQSLAIALLRRMAMLVIQAFMCKKGRFLKKILLTAALKPEIKRRVLKQAMAFSPVS